MIYVIQENVFREEGYDALTETLERLGLDWEVVKVLPFVEDMQVQTDRRDVFVFGSLKMVRLAQEFGWEPGVVLNENYDFLAYRDHYQEHLLNFESRIYSFDDEFPWFREAYFIRPCGDGKEFTGRVFDKESWSAFKHNCATSGHVTALKPSTPIQVATRKVVLKEFRFWIVGGKIVTGSQYKLGSRVVYSDDIDPAAVEFCEQMVAKFQLSHAFVMDVCLVDNDWAPDEFRSWKIVECGCINCAGFYKADMQRLLMALEEEFRQ